MNTVIIDTNILVYAFEYNIDLEEALKEALDTSFEIAIIAMTKKELTGKKNANGIEAWLEKKRVKLINPPEGCINVDQAILAVVDKETYVVTQDKRLKEKLKKRYIPVLSIRQKKYLMIG